MVRRGFAAALFVVLTIVGATGVGAGVVSRRTTTDPEYWTAERLLRARPMPLREIRSIDLEKFRRAGAPGARESGITGSTGSPASPPRAGVAPRFGNQLFDPRVLSSRRSPQREPGPSSLEPNNRGVGPFSLDFSSSRLVPEDARVVWPYSTVGKLVFSGGGRDFICSAAVISSRVVMTAGHCVYDAAAGEFFNSFTFIPAFHRGEAPFGLWTASFVATTDEWINGDDEVPNDADFGVLVMEDQGGMKIGNVTGWLGYKLVELVPNQVKMLGYPANFDSGQRMHQIDSGAFECCFGESAVYGSDMKGGSSGGPWVQNFGVRSRGQTGGRNKQMNRIVGVTSFGPTSRTEKFQGSSIPRASFRELFNEACNEAPGNCSNKGKPKAK